MTRPPNSTERCLIPEDAIILDALKVINEGSKRIAIIVNQRNQLLGVITDGDVRRGLLQGISLNSSVQDIMVKKPTSAAVGTDPLDLIELMQKKAVQQIPLVDKENIVHSVHTLIELTHREVEHDNAVILMVGGLGTRLGELTARCPKPMLNVGGKPILEAIVDNFRHHGFKNFFFAVNYKSEMIEDHFGDGTKWGIHISYLREKERLGTAGSLSLFKPINDLPIVVMNGDLLTQVNFTSLIKHHNDKKLDACSCIRNYDFQIPFGVVEIDGFKITKIEEKPLKSFLVSAGIYVLSPEALAFVPSGSYFDMPSLLEKMLQENKSVGAFPIHEYWLDIGRKDDFEQAAQDYKQIK